MRTIKFKGQKPSNGAWVYGCLVYSNEIEAAIYFQTGNDSAKAMDLVYVDPATVCQFTGFLDKNGKEIYEGDVLRSDTYPFSFTENNEHADYYGTIGWSKDEASFYIMTVKNPKSSVRGIYDGICNTVTQYMMHDFEVVGNIHEEKWQQYGEYFKNEEKEADND